jgi:hypothetical protein
MNANRKLSSIIQGRTVSNVQQADNSSIDITFSDNSKMHIKTSGQVAAANLKNRTISRIQQEGTTLRLVSTDNTATDIPLQEAASSVMLRDKDNQMEYAD